MVDQTETDQFVSLVRAIGLVGVARLKEDPSPMDHRRIQNEVGHALTIEELTALKAEQLQERCILLPYFKKENATWVPVVWVHLLQNGGMSLQLLVLSSERVFGYRWESPSGGEGASGLHDYWHAQPIVNARTPNDKIRDVGIANTNVCEFMPTFPLRARDRATLLGALLVSLYGTRSTIEFLSQVQGASRLVLNVQLVPQSEAVQPERQRGRRSKRDGSEQKR